MVTTLPAGTHSITAVYSGSNQPPLVFCPITSDPVTHVVNAAYPLAVDPPARGQRPGRALVEPTPATGDVGASPVPVTVAAGSALAAAAIAYRRSRPSPQDG